MKLLFLIVSMFGLNAEPINAKFEACPCSKPIKSTQNWCEGTKGGLYCITAKGEKRYKPKAKNKIK